MSDKRIDLGDVARRLDELSERLEEVADLRKENTPNLTSTKALQAVAIVLSALALAGVIALAAWSASLARKAERQDKLAARLETEIEKYNGIAARLEGEIQRNREVQEQLRALYSPHEAPPTVKDRPPPEPLPTAKDITSEGQIIRLIGNEVTVQTGDGKKVAYKILPGSSMTVSGNSATPADLRPGTWVLIAESGKGMAAAIQATPEVSQRRHPP